MRAVASGLSKVTVTSSFSAEFAELFIGLPRFLFLLSVLSEIGASTPRICSL